MNGIGYQQMNLYSTNKVPKPWVSLDDLFNHVIKFFLLEESFENLLLKYIKNDSI